MSTAPRYITNITVSKLCNNLLGLVNRLQWNLDLTKSQGTGKFVRYNEVSLYRGTFSYILLIQLNPGKSKQIRLIGSSSYRG